MNDARRAEILEKLASKWKQLGRTLMGKSTEEVKRLANRGKIPRHPKTQSSVATPGALAETATPVRTMDLS